jgi:hypothetical protein
MAIEDWMITSYEVEFGPEIGSGGLCVFMIKVHGVALIFYFVSGQVFKGSWNRRDVALTILVMEDDVIPNSTVQSGFRYRF